MKNLIVITLALLVIASCAPVKVATVSELSQKAVGKTYKTYTIGGLELKSVPGENFSKNLQHVVGAIDKQMQDRGFVRGPVNPDLLINLGISVTDEVQTRETTIRDAPYHMKYGDGRSYGWQSEEIIVNEYKDGHVVLDFVDTKQNEMIWQGGVTGTLTNKQKKMDKRIDTVFGLLFKKFPLKAN
jgi:hypothetical protein